MDRRISKKSSFSQSGTSAQNCLLITTQTLISTIFYLCSLLLCTGENFSLNCLISVLLFTQCCSWNIKAYKSPLFENWFGKYSGCVKSNIWFVSFCSPRRLVKNSQGEWTDDMEGMRLFEKYDINGLLI